MTEPEQIARFKHLTETVLPALARQHGWPIRLDHCFKRICLDHAFEDIWYNHLKRPAERHLAGPALARAVGTAEEIATKGLAVMLPLNKASLQYRGKLAPVASGGKRTLIGADKKQQPQIPFGNDKQGTDPSLPMSKRL